jgi:hypothetical protein
VTNTASNRTPSGEDDGDMTEAQKNETDPTTHGPNNQWHDDRSDGGAMSPSMRQLILSFGTADSDGTWDRDAYTRRSTSAAKP